MKKFVSAVLIPVNEVPPSEFSRPLVNTCQISERLFVHPITISASIPSSLTIGVGEITSILAIPNPLYSVINSTSWEVNNSNIKLTTTDMELGIETIVDGEIIEPGKIALDAKFFSEIIRKLPDDIVMIETDYDYPDIVSFMILIVSHELSHIEQDINYSRYSSDKEYRNWIEKVNQNHTKQWLYNNMEYLHFHL